MQNVFLNKLEACNTYDTFVNKNYSMEQKVSKETPT